MQDIGSGVWKHALQNQDYFLPDQRLDVHYFCVRWWKFTRLCLHAGFGSIVILLRNFLGDPFPIQRCWIGWKVWKNDSFVVPGNPNYFDTSPLCYLKYWEKCCYERVVKGWVCLCSRLISSNPTKTLSLEQRCHDKFYLRGLHTTEHWEFWQEATCGFKLWSTVIQGAILHLVNLSL